MVNWLEIILCIIPFLVITSGGGILATVARIKIQKKYRQMQKVGVFNQWREANKALFLFEHSILIVFGISFLGIFPLAFLPKHLGEIIAPWLFLLMIISTACAPLHLFLLYRAVNKITTHET